MSGAKAENKRSLRELAVEAFGRGEKLDKFYERLDEIEKRVERLDPQRQIGGR
ncbi:MAG TPA: hypothetical protein VNO43_10115 [Candidatus Eisenbacteria bacterium]|nr:hypothetical protein [Candidatus Eisenbacteria bacterium]